MNGNYGVLSAPYGVQELYNTILCTEYHDTFPGVSPYSGMRSDMTESLFANCTLQPWE